MMRDNIAQQLTREETQKLAVEVFDGIDSDHDGKLSQDEYIRYDLNHFKKFADLSHRKLTNDDIEKIEDYSEDAFNRMDGNKDNYLSHEEFYIRDIEEDFHHLDRDNR